MRFSCTVQLIPEETPMKVHTLVIVSSMLFGSAAFADETKAVDPAKSGPTESMTEQVPDMTAPTTPGTDTTQRPATDAVGDAVPDMKPADSAEGKTDVDKSESAN
jgi:hypothetical protein